MQLLVRRGIPHLSTTDDQLAVGGKGNRIWRRSKIRGCTCTHLQLADHRPCGRVPQMNGAISAPRVAATAARSQQLPIGRECDPHHGARVFERQPGGGAWGRGVPAGLTRPKVMVRVLAIDLNDAGLAVLAHAPVHEAPAYAGGTGLRWMREQGQLVRGCAPPTIARVLPVIAPARGGRPWGCTLGDCQGWYGAPEEHQKKDRLHRPHRKCLWSKKIDTQKVKPTYEKYAWRLHCACNTLIINSPLCTFRIQLECEGMLVRRASFWA